MTPRDVSPYLCESLQVADIDVIIDDRDERAGVKFEDVDLVGIPHRLIVGSKGLKNGVVQFVRHQTGKSRDLPVGRAAESAAKAVLEEQN
ncbi:MAG: His/Gly/Thr/Pro-type tRNA ligase C-terminal domain-containing protein [Myxococcota bacterium]|nr:His/Gly/Thr/Pro-type tRNA ligase C-terminal domain-containing protein [Myxococcota bacterium]